ncbi:PTS sugar transporter subunit IIA [Sporolactobacillus sp. CQH2019]|uniref:PTS sugar transporter subunit IIA n=1 Tax=Sporolactobacillus sp. CQH2019 TaxID=3023512 RepID=UPI0023683063|nr:PTS sugar transporter subunit IIA [Sporolactobacillus sp. CQH2019]MDD9150649.1 PTS sugar transporter subunit IIA [Sporolactobacillus sp. CQH2019]
MSTDIQSLFREDLVFFENVKSKEALFQSVGEKLLQKNLVNQGYIEAITERENKYPTGLDLGVVKAGSSNVAIPHTEVDYCNWKGIVIARLEEEVIFHNMIAPDKSIAVRYAFFILNNEKNSQTNILSHLMSFFTAEDKMSRLDSLKTGREIYQFVVS